ncbi:MAG: hypothetical protein ONB23_09895 [candidate division KSB1 bacterium]|nr:hypothetical protein [candidate division KSB1 bacterium]
MMGEEVERQPKIVTHDDFDGVVSAALVSRALGVDCFVFAGPRTIAESRITITSQDIVCDLPYPLECGMWFDHHEGNLEELRYRGIDPATLAGSFALRDSCARVVYEYFRPRGCFPDFYEETVGEADVLDSFRFASIEEWRKPTPGKMVDAAIKAQEGSPRERSAFLRRLVRQVRDLPLGEVASTEEICRAYEEYHRQEEEMLQVIARQARFLPGDEGQEMVVLDFTDYARPPRVIKKLAFLLYPQAKAVLEVRNLMRGGLKTTDLSVSMSLGINLPGQGHGKDVGEIMRSLNIGDGHAGAAAGTVYCASKAEMLRAKEKLLAQILALWRAQQ